LICTLSQKILDKNAQGERKLLSYLSALGEKFMSELSKRGMNILVPALTGTVLVPILTSQLEETFGIDFSDIGRQVLSGVDGANGKRGRGKGKSKKKRKKDKRAKQWRKQAMK
jgi:hypothetical protein